ncbi:MAG TPA: chromosome partitioning protein ParB, partial [Gemmataceae bacterium]|nr:chromosome partitioning protein ParB [Gemmataceae bacterium]
MEATKPRLGRGLNALIGEMSSALPESQIGPVSKLAVGQVVHNPYQPRKQFDDEELKSLGDSIKN